MPIIAFCLAALMVQAQDPFITTWRTDTTGHSNSTSIHIPTYHFGATYNYDVDWDNDGIYEQTGITDSITHDFGAPGIYTIRIKGDFPRIQFNNAWDKLKILSIDQWGDIAWTSMDNAFYGCTQLTYAATDVPDLSNVTDLGGMFRRPLPLTATSVHGM